MHWVFTLEVRILRYKRYKMNLQHQFTIHMTNITFSSYFQYYSSVISRERFASCGLWTLSRQHNFQCRKSKEQHTTLVAILYHAVAHTHPMTTRPQHQPHAAKNVLFSKSCPPFTDPTNPLKNDNTMHNLLPLMPMTYNENTSIFSKACSVSDQCTHKTVVSAKSTLLSSGSVGLRK